MRFRKKFHLTCIAEWKSFYVDYDDLSEQIKAVKAAAIDLATAYASIKEITGREVSSGINLGEMREETIFWDSLIENVKTVETFYKKQIGFFLEKFHLLTLQAIRLGLIDEYRPLERGLTTRLERELERLNMDVELSSLKEKKTLTRNSILKKQQQQLLRLDRETTFSDVVSTYRDVEKNSGNESGMQIISEDDGGGGESGYDSDTSSSNAGSDTESVHYGGENMVELNINDDGDDYKMSRNGNGESSEFEYPSPLYNKRGRNNKRLPKTFRRPLHSPLSGIKLKNLSSEDLREDERNTYSLDQSNGEDSDYLIVVNRRKAVLHLRRAFAEFYRGLTLLENFAALNIEAIEKILTKHDKNIEIGYKDRFIKETLSNYSFYNSEHKILVRETEHVFALAFTEGHRTAAMKKLRVAPNSFNNTFVSFRFGLSLGITFTFFILSLYAVFSLPNAVISSLIPILIMYRVLFLLCFMTWFWGMDMYIWTAYRVNYEFIFEFDPRTRYDFHHMLEAASLVTMLTMLSFFFMTLTVSEVPGFSWLSSIHPAMYPILVMVCIICGFLWYQQHNGWWLLRTLTRIVCSPFTSVKFKDFYIADQLVSLSLVFVDVEYLVCYCVSDIFRSPKLHTCTTSHTWVFALISVCPSLWRFLQCLRRYYDSKDHWQLANAGKYSTAFFVITFSHLRKTEERHSTIFLVLWILAISFSTIYSFSWDFSKDWSLGETVSGNHMFLRGHLLYPVWWYYWAVITNFVMRFMWTLSISVDSITSLHPEIFKTILAVVEIYRRGQWNVFRLENEQLNNIGKFRALKEIPLPLPEQNPWEKKNDEVK